MSVSLAILFSILVIQKYWWAKYNSTICKYEDRAQKCIVEGKRVGCKNIQCDLTDKDRANIKW